MGLVHRYKNNWKLMFNKKNRRKKCTELINNRLSPKTEENINELNLLENQCVNQKLVEKMFTIFISKVNASTYDIIGVNHFKNIVHKRYEIKIKEEVTNDKVEKSIAEFEYSFLKILENNFPHNDIYTLCYHSESYMVKGGIDLSEYSPYPSGDDVLYFITKDDMIWIPWYGKSIYVLGEKLIHLIDNSLCGLNKSDVITINEKQFDFLYFKQPGEEEQGPVVDIILKANDSVVDCFEISADTFERIDYILKKYTRNYAIYGVTVLGVEEIKNVLRDIENQTHPPDLYGILSEFKELLSTPNILTCIINGV